MLETESMLNDYDQKVSTNNKTDSTYYLLDRIFVSIICVRMHDVNEVTLLK